jgi:hypothetical protein
MVDRMEEVCNFLIAHELAFASEPFMAFVV